MSVPARGDDVRDLTVMREDPSVSGGRTAGRVAGEAAAPRVLKQRFVLEEKLGSGGMGTVFRAKDLRKVEARDRQPFLAIKVLNNDFREHPEAFVALQREAVKSQALSHPNIVSIYDFDKDGDVPFITMELLEGQELADLIRAYPTGLPEEIAWKVIAGMCAGLRHAHEAGIVHADFKPGNVFVSPSSSAKILDFGIARAVQLTETIGEDTLFDPSRLAALTPAYASREMLDGDNPEPRDDIYSLGVVIYLVLTGQHPYGRMSADDAAREGRVPERPRRLSFRQWRALRRCLAFDRQERPASMAEVEDCLFRPSPWLSRSALAAAAAFLLALGLSLLLDEAEMDEVKQEVRQHTLLDAQAARVATLLDEGRFDEPWNARLRQEVETLRGLPGSRSTTDAVRARIRGAFAQAAAATDDLARAVDLLEAGSRFGPMPETARQVGGLVAARLGELLDETVPTRAWSDALDAQLAAVARIRAQAPRLAVLELQAADVLGRMVRRAAETGQLELAEHLLARQSRLEFDRETLDASRNLVTGAELALQRETQERRRESQLEALNERLEAALSASCLRLDLKQLHTVTSAYRDKDVQGGALARIDERVLACLGQLAELDRDRASSLQMEAAQLFGDSLKASSSRIVDPCSLAYLVGNGAQQGRRGYCLDALSNGHQGPRLVVVPESGGPGRFAITKHEVSWGDFGDFCAETGRCSAAHANPWEPVTDVPIELARAFAAWLSERSGFVYRLPTRAEWRLAAQGAPDPNRNCRVRIGGLERGLGPVSVNSGQSNEFGLLNMLGNVQEWVVDGDGISAVGGAYSDPIKDCVAQTAHGHGGQPDPSTGFRLVREIS